MSASTPEAARQTKIFGLRIGVDPKILGGGLVALTLLFLWFNLHGGDDEEHPSNTGAAVTAKPRALTTNRSPVRRSNALARDRGTLSMKPVDPSRGEIDPTLRLGLLERLKAVQFHDGGRNLFEAGSVAAGNGNLPPVPHGPTIIPQPIAPPVIADQNLGAPAIPVNIPLKYYGFVKPGSGGDSNRGFFMQGDNVLVGIEGDMLSGRYLIVSLTPASARVEDTQMKQGQDLRVAPEAVAQ